MERKWVERLLGEAADLEKAQTIRRYVSAVVAANASTANAMPDEVLEEWSSRALAQADRLDPILNAAFKRAVDE